MVVTAPADAPFEKTGVGVLDKSVAIIDLIERTPMTMSEIAMALDANASTTHRLVTALGRHGFIRRDDNGRFHLGRRFAQSAVVDTAGPALESLRDRTGESTQLWVRRGEFRLCCLSFESRDALRVVLAVGSLIPLGEGSAAAILSGNFDQNDGYAISRGTRVAGIGSISAPVIQQGEVIAAVCLAAPLDRMTEGSEARFGTAVKACAAQIQSTLSHSAGVSLA